MVITARIAVRKWKVVIKMEQIVDLIVNNGTAIALLVYFIYKDNKFTEQLTKSLTAINDSLEIIKDEILGKDGEADVK